jgi:hypothetical protein
LKVVLVRFDSFLFRVGNEGGEGGWDVPRGDRDGEESLDTGRGRENGREGMEGVVEGRGVAGTLSRASKAVLGVCLID